MGTAPVMDPYGGPLVIVDKMLGNAYQIVKFVAVNMNFIQFIANNMPAIVALANATQGGQPAAPVSGSILGIANVTYAADTSLAPQVFTLPLISSLAEGLWIEVYDALNNAANNHITVSANGTDTIFNHGALTAPGGAQVISNSNTITRFTIRDGVWRVMQYGA